jgi:hypothetical protein
MALDVGDRFTDPGEWEVITRPHTLAGGKTVHAQVRKVGEPATVERRRWGAHEHLAVRRA